MSTIAKQLQPAIQKRALQKMNAARIRVEGDLDGRVPVKTGKLKRSQKSRLAVGPLLLALTIEYPSDVATFTDKGTRAHIIRSRPGGPTLRFVSGGQVIFRRVVHWRPSSGVAANKRWFSGAVTLTKWREALR